MAIRTGSSTDRGTPAPGELFLNTETRKLEVGDGSGWWATDLQKITNLNGGGGGSARFPADVINLKSWKVTLPIKDGDRILEVEQPELARFKHDSFFAVNGGGNGIRFRVFHGGATTSGSKNPRSELREMRSDGDEAKWSIGSGKHSMEVRGKVNRLTRVKPQVVIGQIHGGSDDVTVWRVEGKSLFITKGDDNHAHKVTDDFELGTEYTIKFEVADGKVRYRFNGDLVPFTLSSSASTCYFKAGNYLQSNPTSASGESTSEFSEVEILALKVTHS
jgi:hypothetical protein